MGRLAVLGLERGGWVMYVSVYRVLFVFSRGIFFRRGDGRE